MVRSALGPQGARLNKGPRAGADFVPAATVVAGSLLALLPIVSATGWWPDFGLLMLLGWRLLRARRLAGLVGGPARLRQRPHRRQSDRPCRLPCGRRS